MPSTTVEVVREYLPDEESAIVEAVHAALVEGIKIPDSDRSVRLIVHQPHRVALPPDRSERYTLVSVDMFEGRSMDAKRRLYQALVANLGKLGIPAEDVKVLLREIPAENWGVRGGKPASEVDLGFKIDV
jgi:phenylpyruvate tautomerase PptA (4-oxalocrotonate tautomerase family)